MKRSIKAFICALLLGSFLNACSSNPNVEYKYPEKQQNGQYTVGGPKFEDRETIFGKGGIGNIFADKDANGNGGGIGVNSFLWRASLDTLSFMPLASADPFGGLIITDWFSPNAVNNERFKINVYIMGKVLRADGIKVTVFRQVKDASSAWIDTKVNPETAIDIENAILTKARKLKMEAVAP